jgi:hypothetical protein
MDGIKCERQGLITIVTWSPLVGRYIWLAGTFLLTYITLFLFIYIYTHTKWFVNMEQNEVVYFWC